MSLLNLFGNFPLLSRALGSEVSGTENACSDLIFVVGIVFLVLGHLGDANYQVLLFILTAFHLRYFPTNERLINLK
jgi:hypothetical protein